MSFRSPPQLRSGTKGKHVPLSASDKPKLQRSLSASSSASCTESTVAALIMSPPPTAAKSALNIDLEIVERCVNKYLSENDVFSNLVTRLSETIRVTVEEAVRNALADVNAELDNLRGQVTVLEKRVGNLCERLEDRTDELEQYQRRNNLRFFGVDESRGEDTDALVVELCRSKLGVELSTGDICRSHRVGQQPEPNADGKKRSRGIIVRFVSYRVRRKIYDAKKMLKGSGVTVREDLTVKRAEVYRQAVSKHGLKNTWTQDGRVLYVDKENKKGMATRLADLTAAPPSE